MLNQAMVLTEYDNTQHSLWIWLMGAIALVMFGADDYEAGLTSP